MLPPLCPLHTKLAITIYESETRELLCRTDWIRDQHVHLFLKKQRSHKMHGGNKNCPNYNFSSRVQFRAPSIKIIKIWQLQNGLVYLKIVRYEA